MCGGTSEVKAPDQEIQDICEKLRESVEETIGRKFTSYKVKAYKTQVVAGTNYFVKIEVDDGKEYLHVRIFRPLPHTGGEPEFHSHQEGKTMEDDIEYF